MEIIAPHNAADNNGGGCYLFLIRHDHAEPVPIPQSEYAEPVVLLPGKEFTVIVPSEGTLSFSETQETDTGDDAYRVQITLSLPKNTPERLELQRRTKGNRYILIFKDRNGNALLIGNTAEPLRIVFNRETGAEFQDLNAVTLSAEHVFRYPAPFYDAEENGLIQVLGNAAENGTEDLVKDKTAIYDANFAYLGFTPLITAQDPSK
jgi:hypothetical protein